MKTDNDPFNRATLIRILAFSLCVPFLCWLTGCCTTPIAGSFKMPAEVNMAGRDRVILDTVKGQGGNLMTARLKPELARAGFTVLDRSSFGTASNEEILRQISGAGSQSGTAPKVTTAAVLIKGNVLRHDFNHAHRQVKFVQNGVEMVGYVDEGTATVEAAFDVVELATTQVIATKSIQATQSGQTDVFSSPPSLNPEPLYNDCYTSLVYQFMKVISPYNVAVRDCMDKISKLPENDSGVGMFMAGDYGRAVKDFEAALESAKTNPKIKPTHVSKVWHNLGLAHEFGGNYEQAVSCYRQALALQPNAEFQKSLNRALLRLRTKSVLQDQIGGSK